MKNKRMLLEACGCVILHEEEAIAEVFGGDNSDEFISLTTDIVNRFNCHVSLFSALRTLLKEIDKDTQISGSRLISSSFEEALTKGYDIIESVERGAK